MEQPISAPVQKVPVQGVLCGAGSALCWALGFVAARHGVLSGMSPLVLALHRFVWPGIVLLPVILTNGLSNLGGLGWHRGIIITVFGGLPLALWSYFGYLFVPLGHGTIIQPSCAALGGLVLARLVLREPLPPHPDRRCAHHCAWALRNRGGGAGHYGPQRLCRRSVICRRRAFVRDLRHAAPALAYRCQAGHGGDERTVTIRIATAVFQLSEFHCGWFPGELASGRGAGPVLPAPAPSICLPVRLFCSVSAAPRFIQRWYRLLRWSSAR
jgi:hypothetical protein